MTVETTYPEARTEEWLVDPGVVTLNRMASVDRYNDWIYRSIEPHIGQRILEVGCGLGNMTAYMTGRECLVSIDLLQASVERVEARFAPDPGFEVLQADILAESTVELLRGHQFDTVVCLNVLEHIDDDSRALDQMCRLLVPGGKLLLLVPACSFLFGSLDMAIGHHRRYDARDLSRLLASRGFEATSVRYFNIFGMPGWFLASRLLRRRVPPRGLLRLFNVLAPMFIWIESVLKPNIGQSLLCIATPRRQVIRTTV